VVGEPLGGGQRWPDTREGTHEADQAQEAEGPKPARRRDADHVDPVPSEVACRDSAAHSTSSMSFSLLPIAVPSARVMS
jgi:hypothetical protein